jgi:alpha-tubulin suppressor-like RCC1 family protein
MSVNKPRRINSLPHIVAISAGGMHSACVSISNKCYTWGSNTYGQLGIGKCDTNSDSCVVAVPTQVFLENDGIGDLSPKGKGEFFVTKISCGGMHTGAIAINGEVFCWGKADSGQTGSANWYLGFSTNLYYPRRVRGLSEFATDISCGGFYTLVLTSGGEVFAMGKEDYGQCTANISLSNMSYLICL